LWKDNCQLTTRERNLLVIFLLVVLSAGIVVAVSSYLEAITRLDTEFITLQKRALRLAQASIASQGAADAPSLGNVRERFFSPGTLPDPLTLASRVQAAMKAAGLASLESRVLESTATAQWVQYRAEGPIESWFRFLQLVRGQDPKTLFRTVSLAKRQGFIYAISFEVGHVVAK